MPLTPAPNPLYPVPCCWPNRPTTHYHYQLNPATFTLPLAFYLLHAILLGWAQNSVSSSRGWRWYLCPIVNPCRYLSRFWHCLSFCLCCWLKAKVKLLLLADLPLPPTSKILCHFYSKLNIKQNTHRMDGPQAHLLHPITSQNCKW